MRYCFIAKLLLVFSTILPSLATAAEDVEDREHLGPVVGQNAPDIELEKIAPPRFLPEKVRLSDLWQFGNVIIVFGAGTPNQPCPVYGGYSYHYMVDMLDEYDATMVMCFVKKPSEFRRESIEAMRKSEKEGPIHFLSDERYKVTKAYGLRWEAPDQTAYPAVIVINCEGKVVYSEVSPRGLGFPTPAFYESLGVIRERGR